MAVLGDFNEELINAYRIIRSHPRVVARAIESIPFESDAYYFIRALDPMQLTDVERAARFAYLNRYCFNGVYRTDRANRFNVPIGTRPGRPLAESEIYRCSVALRCAEIVAGDFQDVLGTARRGDFVYLDPPYTSFKRPLYGEYGYGAFGADDIERLLSSIKRLTTRGAQVLFSFVLDKQLESALREWSVVEVDVLRKIRGGANSGRATEILASNYIDLNTVLCDGTGVLQS